MGDFSDVFEFLISLVAKIVDASLNVIVTVFLIFACIPPWRFAQICDDYSHYETRRPFPWKEFCMFNFFQTIANLFSTMLTLVGIFSPVRWYGVGIILGQLLSCKREGTNERSIFAGIRMVIAVIADLLCSFLGIFTLLSPFGRQFVLFRMLLVRDVGYGNRADIDRAVSLETSMNLAMFGMESIVDIGVFLLSLSAVFVPTTWACFYLGVASQWNNSPQDPPTVFYVEFQIYKNRWNQWFDATRDHFFVQFLHAWIDLFVSPFFLLAIISPFRQGQVLAMVKCGSSYSATATTTADQPVDQPGNVEENGIAESLANYHFTPAAKVVGDFEFEYDYEIRKKVVYFGLLAMSDLFLIPMIAPLFITQYRYRQMRDDLYPEDGSWGHKQLYLVASQFCLLCFDALYLPLTLPFLFLTYFRWGPVGKMLQKEKIFLKHSSELYCTILCQIVYLFVDILFIPIVIILLCSHRGPAVWNRLRDPILRNEHSLTTYMYLITNLLTYIHDLVFLLPVCIAIAVIALHRFPLVIHHITSKEFEESHPFPTYDATSPQYSHTTIDRYIKDRFKYDWSVRFKIWHCFFSALFDIPFFVMGAVTFGTGWRAFALYEDLKAIKPYYSARVYTYYELMKDAPFRIRGAIFEQFVKLLRDILCLIPFTVVVVSLYRLPALIISFMSSLAANPLLDTAALGVFEAKITFVEGAEPQLTVFLKGNQNLNDMSATHFKFYILGMQLWNDVGSIFGGFVAGFAKSFLPLPFEIKKNLQWKVKVLENYIPIEVEGVVSTAQDGSDGQVTPLINSLQPQVQNLETIELVLTLPLKGVKKSTIAKKLSKFPTITKMVFQMECKLQNNSEALPEKKALFRWTPQVSHVLQALEAEDGSFPLQSFVGTEGASLIGQPQRFVDEFHMSVIKVFIEVMLDLFHLTLFCATLISPYRLYLLIAAMLQSKESVSKYLMEKILTHLQHAENHLRSYRASMAGTFNDACKDLYQTKAKNNLDRYSYADRRRDRDNYYYYPYYYFYSNASMISEQLKAKHSQYDYERYKSLAKSMKHDMKLLQEGTEGFVSNITDILSLHDEILEKWMSKTSIWTQMGDYDFTRQQKDLISFVLTEQHDNCAKKVIGKQQEAQRCLHAYAAQLKEQKPSKLPGFLKKSADENRAIIRSFFGKALLDWTGLAMLCLLFVTVIRLFPFLRDLIEQRRDVFTHPTLFRSVLVKHSRALATDGFHIAHFLFYTFFVVLSVGGIPDFLADLVNHMQSFQSAAHCAKIHGKKFFENLFYLLSLITFYRSYRIIFKSVLYCILIPGAMIGECFDMISEANIKFTIGSFLYFGILTACIATSVQIKSDGLEYRNANRSNDAILAISAVIVIFLLFGAVVKISKNKAKPGVEISDTKKFAITWPHVAAVLTGPIECLQLSAIIMNFFWHPVTIEKNHYVVTDTRYEALRIGGDHLSTIMFWGSEQSDDSSIYRTGLKLAAVFVIIWAIIIAIPIAQGGSDAKKKQKVMEVRNSAIYDTCFNFFSNIISVWIIATLMRTWSCMQYNGVSVLSTMEATTCGGGAGFWPASVSFPFLSYYLITSGLAYSDTSTDPSTYQDDGEAVPFVRFGDAYSILVKTTQLFICAACFGAYGTAPAIAVLFPIMFICVISGFLPYVLKMFTEERICNVPAIVPFRSASYFGVLWTCFVCLVRSFSYSPESMQHTVIFASEGTIYVGWAVIFIAGFIASWRLESYLWKTWNEKMLSEGLGDATASLLNLYQMAMVETSTQTTFFSKNKTGMLRLQKRAEKAGSIQDIAMMVLELEQNIVIDKLNDEFLLDRTGWKEKLRNVYQATAMDSYVIEGHSVSAERDRFNVVLGQMNILLLGFRSNLATTPLSRDVFSILLSNKIPRDVCWYIFEFLINTKELQENFALSFEHAAVPPKLLSTKFKSYPALMLSSVQSNHRYTLKKIEKMFEDKSNKETKGPNNV